MKTLNKVKIFKTSRILTENEQSSFRLKFKPFLNTNGIISLCLEERHLYLEYNSSIFNLTNFKNKLNYFEFPLKNTRKSITVQDVVELAL